ncbi:metallophosphoesterase family protein [Luteolibacter marinus]|uniref:metallophosphoesterase family protein n=1 Tax=Luteolibacter marinus TaxID=2776705 RepID=UPI00186808FE|nr:metallophosphoesterase [Luteolibacter marinus]
MQPDRRDFISRSLLAATALSAPAAAAPAAGPDKIPSSFALDGNRVRLFSPRIAKGFTVTMIADTHLFRDDERDEAFRQFSGRMAGAYNSTRHFLTGQPTNPEQGFVEALQAAKTSKSELVALVGDIVSFPSQAAVEWAVARLREASIPWIYTAGNHDWHYEGMPGPLDSLRATWSRQRLAPLYQQAPPLMSVRELHGVRFVTIDDSTYEILPEQLEFFREQVASGVPLVLFVHIPLFAPGRDTGYGCGHPRWGAASDTGFEVERRPKWREGGHTRTTLDFHREVFAAPNLLGVFAGHIHRASLDVVNGIPQFVGNANATGAFVEIELVPQA